MTDHREELSTVAREHHWRCEPIGRYLQFIRNTDRISVSLAEDGTIRKAVWANRTLKPCGHPVAIVDKDDPIPWKRDQVEQWLTHVAVLGLLIGHDDDE